MVDGVIGGRATRVCTPVFRRVFQRLPVSGGDPIGGYGLGQSPPFRGQALSR